MTAERDCYVTCDGCGESEPSDRSARTVEAARAAARADGWRVGLPGGRDLCSDCR